MWLHISAHLKGKAVKSYSISIDYTFNYKSMFKSRNAATMMDSSPSIEDRSSDHTGKTIYRVRWPDQTVAWESIPNLKDYHHLIKEFEHNYEKRIIDWNCNNNSNQWGSQTQKDSLILTNQFVMQTSYPVVPPSKMEPILIGSENCANDSMKTNNEKLSDFQDNLAQIQAEGKKYILLGRQGYEQSFINQTIIAQQLQQQKQRRIQEQKRLLKFIRMEKCKQIAKVLIKRVPKQTHSSIKIVRKKYTPPRRSQVLKSHTISKINGLFQQNNVWYAQVINTENQEIQVLKDALKFLSPELMLNFYQEYVLKKSRHATHFL